MEAWLMTPSGLTKRRDEAQALFGKTLIKVENDSWEQISMINLKSSYY
jgi:hypothetical protein